MVEQQLFTSTFVFLATEFQIINGTTSSVCATTNINPSQDLQGWIFQPKVSDTSGNFTVTTINGPSLSFCAYESRQLVVTVPSRSSTGRFGVVFVSQSGVSVALSVRYGECIGFMVDD